MNSFVIFSNVAAMTIVSATGLKLSANQDYMYTDRWCDYWTEKSRIDLEHSIAFMTDGCKTIALFCNTF